MSPAHHQFQLWDGTGDAALATGSPDLPPARQRRDDAWRWRLLVLLTGGTLSFTLALLCMSAYTAAPRANIVVLLIALVLQVSVRPWKAQGSVEGASRRLVASAIIACAVAAMPGTAWTLVVADVFLLASILVSGVLLSATSPLYIAAYGVALVAMRGLLDPSHGPIVIAAYWRALIFVTAAIASVLNSQHMRRTLEQSDRTEEVERLYSILQGSYRALEENHSETRRQAREVSQLNSQLISMQEELQRSYHELEEKNRLLHEQATTDCMTGLANHRAFQQALRAQTSQALRHRLPLSLLMIDVDHFKKYNDSFGHPAGDEALHTIGELIRNETRSEDVPARYGGEEFAVLLPYTDLNAAAEVGERIRAATATTRFEHAPLTISVGVAALHLSGVDANSLVDAADNALYSAKQAGRNRVVCAPAQNGAPPDGAGDATSVGPAQWQTGTTKHQRKPVAGLPTSNDVARNTGGLEGLIQEPSGTILSALLRALEMRNQEPVGHSYRVACFSIRLARELQTIYGALREEMPLLEGITPDDVRGLALGAALHDIGKYQVPDYILWKMNKLTSQENATLRLHTVVGAQLVGSVEELAPALPVVRHHHERWDGRGYPDGLEGDSIPLIARVCAVADTFDILTTGTRFRPAIRYVAANNIITRQAGRKFDPLVVRAFGMVPPQEWELIRLGDTTGNLRQAA